MSNAWIDKRRREQEWPVRLLVGTDLPSDDPELPTRTGRLVVTTGIRQPPDAPAAIFSTTAELIDRSKPRSEWHLRVGQMPDLIARYLPDLEPLLGLHGTEVGTVPAQQAEEAVDLLLRLGATDNRVATAAAQFLTHREQADQLGTDERWVRADPYTARQCPECEAWIYVADGPFAEGDRTKTEADWLHWEQRHLDPGRVEPVETLPYFRYNDGIVDAVIEPRAGSDTAADGRRQDPPDRPDETHRGPDADPPRI